MLILNKQVTARGRIKKFAEQLQGKDEALVLRSVEKAFAEKKLPAEAYSWFKLNSEAIAAKKIKYSEGSGMVILYAEGEEMPPEEEMAEGMPDEEVLDMEGMSDDEVMEMMGFPDGGEGDPMDMQGGMGKGNPMQDQMYAAQSKQIKELQQALASQRQRTRMSELEKELSTLSF